MSNDNKVHELKSVYNKLAKELKELNEKLEYGANATEEELAELEFLTVAKRSAAIAVANAAIE